MTIVATVDRASARETAGFRLGLAVIAVAVLDDASTRRLSALLPVAVAAVLAWRYPHWRAGMRATVAIVCGVLAIVAGVVVGSLTAAVGGLIGVGLMIDGLVRLWRSRRHDGRRWLRRTLLVVGAFLAGFFVLFPVAFAIVATHKPRSPVADADLGRPYERVSLETDDGLRVAAWYVPSRNGAAVIVFPGRSGPVRHARMLVRHGYGVLLLDRRGEGESEGELNRFGWNGEGDLRAALDFLAGRPDVKAQRIGGLGLSVGGELLLQTAARDARLRAIVSEGAGVRSLREHLHTPGVGRVQRWGSNWVVQTAALAVLSGTLPPPDLAALSERIAPRPVLLIRARDGHADEALNAVYAERVGPSATLWTASGAHTGALAHDPAGYDRRVTGFLDAALLGG